MKYVIVTLLGVLTAIAGGILAMLSFGIGYSMHHVPKIEHVPEPDFAATQAAVLNPVSGSVYTLHGSGIDSDDTSITLSSLDIPGTTSNLVMADFGDFGCATVEPGRTKREFVKFTGITQNADGTATLTGVTRGLSPVRPYTASTTLQQTHSGGSKLIFSDSAPCFFEQIALLGNDNIFYGFQQFSSTTPPAYDALPTLASTTELAHKKYVDDSVNQGAATSTEDTGGISELATAIEQASSTDLGVDVPLVLQAKYATDTPQSGCASGFASTAGAGCTAIGNLLGWLDTSWFGALLAADNTWTGNNTFNTATTTMSSGVDITAASLATSPFRINGIDYVFPSVQTASSTILTTDGSGNLSWDLPGWDLIGEATLTGSASSISVDSLPDRDDLLILATIDGQGGSGARTFIQFNDDTTGTYGTTATLDGGVGVASSTVTSLELTVTGVTTEQTWRIHIDNSVAANRKFVDWTGVQSASAASAPGIVTGAGVWNNTAAAISKITLFPGGAGDSATFGANTRINIYGSRE